MSQQVMFFNGYNYQTGFRGVWVSDGLAAGTHELAGISGAAAGGINPQSFAQFGAAAMFGGMDANGKNGLWISDGTAAGTHELFGIVGAGLNGIAPSNITTLNGEAFFRGINAGGKASLWVSDGTSAGTHELTGISGASANGIAPAYMTGFNGKVIFAGTDNTDNTSLWITDGTSAGTHELTGISGAAWSGGDINPSYLTLFNGEVLFGGFDASLHSTLWETDGTSTGTVNLANVGVYSPYFTVLNGEAYFQSSSSAYFFSPGSLNVTDGTPAGTHGITVNGVSSSDPDFSPSWLMRAGGKLLFSGPDVHHQQGLWVSDGTTAGTSELNEGVKETNGTSLGSVALFNGNNDLWISDGTYSGTYALALVAVDIHNRLDPTGLVPISLRSLAHAPFSHVDNAADVDGDRRTDWIQFDNGNVDVWHSSGTAFDPLSTWTTGATASDRTADLNGDGKSDLVQFFAGSDHAGYIYGALSNGSTFNDWKPWIRGATASDRLADMNGDGKTDLVQYFSGVDHAGHVEVALSNGSSFAAYSDWLQGASSTDQLIDMNGDGKSDLLQLYQGREYVALSNGTGFDPWLAWLGAGGTSSDRLKDVEGLHRPDLVQLYNGRVLVAHNNGTGFGPWQDWLPTGESASTNVRFADMNGDGRDDLVSIDSAGNVSVALSNGSSFDHFAVWGSGATASDRLHDFNGDGKTDLLQVSPNGTAYVALSTGSGLSPWSVWATGPNGGNAGAAGVTDTSASTASGSSSVPPSMSIRPIPDIALLNNYMASSFVTDGGTGGSSVSQLPSTDQSTLFANPVQMHA